MNVVTFGKNVTLTIPLSDIYQLFEKKYLKNSEIREDTFTPEPTTDVVRCIRILCFGHICRMPRENCVG